VTTTPGGEVIPIRPHCETEAPSCPPWCKVHDHLVAGEWDSVAVGGGCASKICRREWLVSTADAHNGGTIMVSIEQYVSVDCWADGASSPDLEVFGPELRIDGRHLPAECVAELVKALSEALQPISAPAISWAEWNARERCTRQETP
jgi:hypothetical protein